MNLEKAGKRMTAISIYGLLVITINFLTVDAVTTAPDLRGIIFGIIMYGVFLGLFFGPFIIMLQFFDKTVVIPMIFIMVFSFVELFCIEEGYIGQYFVFIVPLSSILHLIGKIINRIKMNKKTC